MQYDKEVDSSVTQGEKSEYLPYKNDEHNIKLLYPKGWKKAEGNVGTVVSFASPKDASGLTSVNLLIQELPEHVTLEEFTQQSLEQMQAMLENAAHRVWNAPLLGKDGKRLQFEAPMGPFMMTVYQAWTVTDKRAFIITFSSPSATHNDYRKDMEVLIGSLEVLGAQDPTKKPIDLCCFRFYENLEHKFRIKCPLSWQVVPSNGPVFQAEFNGTLGPKDSAPAHLRLDVVVTNLPDPTWDLDKYSQISSLRLADITDDGEIPQKKKITMGDRDGYEVTYKSDVIKKGMLSKQRYTIKDGKAYIVTTSAASIKDDDIRPFPLFERLYLSFEFLDENNFVSKSNSVDFEHLIHRVSIEFTEGWRPSSGLGTVVNFEHGGNGANIPFDSSLSLVVADPPDAIDTLEAFGELMKKQLSMGVDSAEILNETETTLAGLKGTKLQYKGQIANTSFKFDQYFVLKDGKAYIISFNALTDAYEREAALGKVLIDSFSLF